MDIPDLIVGARQSAGLSLRELAMRAGTSHSTLSAYETGRVAPSVATLERVLDAAGLAIEIDTVRRIRRTEHLERADELKMVLDLAEMFPARFAETLDAPRFGRVR